MSVTIVANPRAGGGRRSLAPHYEALARYGAEVETITPSSVVDVAPAVADAGGDRVLLAGGDGLVHQAIGTLAETGRPFGILPVGTGNDFARALGLVGKPDKLVAKALGPVTPTDALVCDVDGTRHIVASSATAGFSGQVNERANRLRWPRGSAKYTAATLAQLRSLTPEPLARSIDGVETASEVTFFAVANTAAFGGGMRIAPDAEPDDGELSLVVVDDVGPLTLAAVLPLVFIGQHVRHPAVHITRTDRVDVTLPASWSLWGDGELLKSACSAGEPSSRVSFTINPGCLRLAR